MDRLDAPLNALQERELLAGRAKWWVVAKVTYVDIFGKRRWSTLRAEAEADGIFTISPEGNDFS